MLTTDYINHFGALAMLLDIVPDFPEAVADLMMWQPKSYEAHLRGISFTDPEPLLAAYGALAPMVRAPFDSIVDEANRYGAQLIMLLREPVITDEERRSLCAIGAAALGGMIQQMNALIAGTQDTAPEPLPPDVQAHIDRLMARD